MVSNFIPFLSLLNIRGVLITRITIAVIILQAIVCISCSSKNEFHATLYPETERSYPMLEVEGSYYDIGYAIGDNFKDRIKKGFDRRAEWFESMKEFCKNDRDNYIDKLKEESEKHFPDIMEELRGMADGSGIPFDDLFLFNVKAEIGAKMAAEKPDVAGCSTIHLSDSTHKWLFHNEDGNVAYADLMYVVKATTPSGVTILALTYPGHLMGNGPSMNSNGIVQTTNYIGSAIYKKGVPRYFLNRAPLEAETLDEAVRLSTYTPRAFAYHHNLGSFKEKRLLSVEVTPDNYQVEEPRGIYFHTNHLILPETKDYPQDTAYVNSSSMSRFTVITGETDSLMTRIRICEEDIISILSSHKGAPYSPCRHPDGEIEGITLSTAFFDLDNGIMRIYKGNPCNAYKNDLYTDYRYDDLNRASGF